MDFSEHTFVGLILQSILHNYETKLSVKNSKKRKMNTPTYVLICWYNYMKNYFGCL